MNPLSDHDQRRAPAVLELHMTLPAQLATPSVARERLGRWLTAHGWPPGQYDDLILAVSEAVSNSVEHGYGVSHGSVEHAGAALEGLVEVHGAVQTDQDGRRRAVLTVVDHGTWLPPSAFRGNRRHGLPLMEACVEAMTVEGTGDGTTVVLRSRPVPPPLDPG